MEVLKLFKMLSDKTRIRIIMLLFHGSLCVCELEEILGITQVNVSRHLMKLKGNNIVKTKRTSRRIYYHLNNDIKNNKIFNDFIDSIIKTEAVFIEDLKKYKKHIEDGYTDYHCKSLTRGNDKDEV